MDDRTTDPRKPQPAPAPEMLADIGFYAPRTLAEALELKAELKGKTRVVAGGTDVMVWQGSHRQPLPASYLSIWGLRELKYVRVHDGVLQIGALATYTELLASRLLHQHFPDLADACAQVGAVQIQNRGTLAGNVVNASPAGDSIPSLAVHDAVFVLESRDRGERRVPFADFYLGYRQTALAEDELLTRVELVVPPNDTACQFAKIGSRRAQTISKAMGAIRATFDAEGRFESVAIAFGAVAPVIVRMPQTEAAMIGHHPSVSLIDRIEHVLQQEISPISDVRSDAAYRRFVTAGILRRFMRAWEPEGGRIVELPFRA